MGAVHAQDFCLGKGWFFQIREKLGSKGCFWLSLFVEALVRKHFQVPKCMASAVLESREESFSGSCDRVFNRRIKVLWYPGLR